MRLRQLWLAFLILPIPSAAYAHGHNMDWSLEGSAMSGSTLGGIHACLAITLPSLQDAEAATKLRRLSVVGDVSMQWGSDDRKISTAMGGLRYTFARSAAQRKLPFVHVLVGGVFTDNGNGTDEHPAVAIGGGFDSMIWGGVESGWGIRAQGDYVVRAGKIHPRASIGFVKRLPRKR